ncbi:sulfotransferase [Sphingomonas sp. PvP055]|uniref:tetratricopeptide repeat-containing sulfotransferase family protein n=1 Tax=Sphingomonas sp. PvP055 TaxID=3156391 RepID=UPI003393AF4B
MGANGMIDAQGEAARRAIGAGDADRARQLAAGIKDRADARFVLGLADAVQGRVSAGIAHLEAAIAVASRAEYLAQLARLLILVRRDGEARVAAEAAVAAGPEDALTYDTIGCIHARLGDHQAALRCFEPAVAEDGANLEYRYNLALALGFVGRTAEATAQYEILLARAPRHGRAHYALSGLAKATPATNNITRLEAVLAEQPSPDDALRIRYALAKEYDDVGDAERAFRHLSAANTAHKVRIAYDFSSDAAIFDAIEAAFGDPTFFSGPSQVEDAPIFVIGMPRTGTTLVDRILSSHPDVHSAGELQAMPLAIKQLSGTRSRLITDPETIRASGALSPDAVGRAYMAHATQHRRRADGRFIDKLPANFLHVGYIARALPHASIVCLRRNPMDTVWSNYKNLFATTSAYYAYSHDLVDTARYYARFDRLMALWDRLLPGRVLQLGYEALVAQQERESRRLFAHCGLDWTDSALDFHTNTAAVATPSAAQVRRPMYRDSVERWRAHETTLAPVRAFFESAGIAV